MEPKDMIFQLCENDEQIVRTYECTRLRQLFYPVTIGYLTITNKRVVFHSRGKSFMGKSVLINEMPLEDTAGVRAYLEISINWLIFVIFCALLFVVTGFIYSHIPVLVNWIFGIILLLPFTGIWILNSNLLSDQTRDEVYKYINERFQNKIQAADLFPILVPSMRILFFIGTALVGWGIAFSTFFLKIAPFNYLLILALYFWIYLSTFGQQRTFSLTIGSKTMKGSGIYIPGSTFLTLLTRDNTAPNTLGAGAAKDAEKVTQEIGAVLMDIRQLGDLGIQKWRL